MITAPKLRMSTVPSFLSWGCSKRSLARGTLRSSLALVPLTLGLPVAMTLRQVLPG